MGCALLVSVASQDAGKGQLDSGDIRGTVAVRRDGAVADASGVVLYLIGFSEAPSPDVVEMRQVGKHFVPDLLPITAGQAISFPNFDPYFHNVFSVSPTRAFDLGEYRQGETKVKRFPKPGVVDVYCNIHPEMAATILVLPNRRFVHAGSDGRFSIRGVPVGRWTLYAFSRRVSAPTQRPVEVKPGESLNVLLSLDESAFEAPHLNKYGEKYRDSTRYPR
jgi:plastocyanin